MRMTAALRHKLPLAHITLQSARHPPQRFLMWARGRPSTLSFKPEVSFYRAWRASAQVSSASRAGHSSCPHSVRPYSTFGGT